MKSHLPFVTRTGCVSMLAMVFAASMPTTAQADGLELVLKHGKNGDRYERSGLGLRFAPLWSDDWGKLKLTLLPEVELTRLRYTGKRSEPDHLDQAGLIGLLRAHYGDARLRPYAEIGLGAALFSRTRLGGKNFSTSFQFSEHLGAGIEFADRWSLGWQFSHYSNADIEIPNNGINFHQIMLGVRF
ncbi:MAG: acyloxyacyl hydrolase [Azoarcus sp.]|nr:acyloxyacyl hydrolase [Azoarcus sp.]